MKRSVYLKDGIVPHPKNSKIMGIPTINKVTAINGIMMFRIPFVGFFMSMRNYQVTNHKLFFSSHESQN